MNYTLYIDESGDFETHRGQWVLSGVLFAEGFDNCEKQLNDKLSTLPKELGVKSMKNFHLTEFRRDFGHNEAVIMARETINKLNKLPFNYYCLAAINHSKSALSNPEKTYRLMLSDILALCETVIGDNQVITKLDLVVASRTIDGELQTSISNINQEIIKSLPIALEVDLATKGMVDLIGKHINVKMDYANNSWGLICADFLANLNYHYKKTNEKTFLNELEKKGKYSLFESFGSFEIRRANVAERDHDYTLALVRWLIIHLKSIETDRAKEAVQRLLYKMFNKSGTTGAVIAFEAILDNLWRRYNMFHQYSDLAILLSIFETELMTYISINRFKNNEGYLFRLRNLILLIDNHLGKTSDGFKVAKLQREAISVLASNPEYFQMILDFKISEIEVYVNALNFKESLNLAEEYSSLMSNFKEVWQLLSDENDPNIFDNSRASVKAQMTLFRCNVLLAGINGYIVDEQLLISFEHLGNRLINSYDISRYRNYHIMLLLKQMKPNVALNYALESYLENDNASLNAFDLFWLIRAANDALLNEISIDSFVIQDIIKNQLPNIDINMNGHPIDLILRELALLEFQFNNKSAALKYIRKSKKAFNLENSEIGLWLNSLINIHEDYILGKMISENSYFELLAQSTFVEEICESSIGLPLLRKVRYFSPY